VGIVAELAGLVLCDDVVERSGILLVGALDAGDVRGPEVSADVLGDAAVGGGTRGDGGVALDKADNLEHRPLALVVTCRSVRSLAGFGL